jgi:hypothetical protein
MIYFSFFTFLIDNWWWIAMILYAGYLFDKYFYSKAKSLLRKNVITRFLIVTPIRMLLHFFFNILTGIPFFIVSLFITMSFYFIYSMSNGKSDILLNSLIYLSITILFLPSLLACMGIIMNEWSDFKRTKNI